MNQHIIWKKIKKQLKKKQPSHAYSTWFAPINPIAFNNNTLILELPNQFFFEWIQSHYKKVILQTATNLINDDIEIFKMLTSFYNISLIRYKTTPIPDKYRTTLENVKQSTKTSKIRKAF